MVILLATLHLINATEVRSLRPRLLPLVACIGTGLVLVWGTLVLPPFGTPDAPIHRHVAPRYLANSIDETHVPNVVTAVLADYRGYDTLGETTVIFTAGIGVMLLLRGARRRGRDVRENTP
jgi:multicomponent Na+:H+ antiporter subunit B